MQQMIAPEKLRRRWRQRTGSTATEVLVSATLLLSLIAVVVPTTVRTAKIWRDTRHYQVATNELSNQLELLSSMSDEQQTEAIKQLTVSEPTSRILSGATLAAELANDSNGNRVTLSINWERTTDAPPLKITGWLKAAPLSPSDRNEPSQPALKESSDEAK